VRAHDWRGTLRHMWADACGTGAAELSLLDVGCGAGAFTAALAASGALLDRPAEVGSSPGRSDPSPLT